MFLCLFFGGDIDWKVDRGNEIKNELSPSGPGGGGGTLCEKKSGMMII